MLKNKLVLSLVFSTFITASSMYIEKPISASASMCDAASYGSLTRAECLKREDYLNTQRQMAQAGCGWSGCVQNKSKSNDDKKWDWRLILLGAFVVYKILPRR
jgi:hypothetical protein